jgi:hypothetical protein
VPVYCRDPGGVCPLLEETGLVEDQHGVRVAQRLDDMGPQIVAGSQSERPSR